MDGVIKKAQLLTLAFAIAAPCLLAAGYGYYVGILVAYGIDSSLFDRGISEVVTESWLVAIMLVLYVWQHIWWLLGYCLILLTALSVFFYWVAWNKAKGKTPEFLKAEITKENPGLVVLGMTQWAWKCYVGILEEFYSFLMWPFLAFCLALAVAFLPFKLANSHSKELKESIDKHGCHPRPDVEVKYTCIQMLDITETPNKLLAEGILVNSDAKRIAIYSNKKFEVWPLLDTYKITRTTE